MIPRFATLLFAAAAAVGVVLAAQDSHGKQPDLSTAAIDRQVYELSDMKYDEAILKLEALPPAVVARCAARSPRVRDLSSGLQQWPLVRLLDPDTPYLQLEKAVIDLDAASRVSSPLQAKLRDLKPAEAAYVYDRVIELKVDAKVEFLLGKLAGLPHATAFVSVIVGDVAKFYATGTYELRHDFPKPLIALLTNPRWKAEITQALQRVSARLPPVVTNAVGRIARAIHKERIGRDHFVKSPYRLDASLISKVGALFPAPFNLVFPFNSPVAEGLFNELRNSKVLLKPGVVEDLALLGLRFDLQPFLDFNLHEDNSDLRAILHMLRPERHLFDQVKMTYPAKGLAVDCGQFMVDKVSVPGDVGYLVDHRQYLIRLLETWPFAAYLQRHPMQLYSAVAALIGRKQWMMVDRVAQHPLLEHPEFSSVAEGLLRFMIDDKRRDSFSDASVVHLSTLRHLDLCDSSSGTAPLVLLYRNRDKFNAVLHNVAFLQRLKTDRCSLPARDRDAEEFFKKLRRSTSRIRKILTKPAAWIR